MPSNHLILCCPLLLLPPLPPSIRVFSNESTLRTRWPKYWSFSFSVSPSNEHPGLISFRTDWLYLLAIQGTLKGLPQHHSSKASILRRSAFFTVQLSHPRGLIKRLLEDSKKDTMGASGVATKMAGNARLSCGHGVDRKGREADTGKNFQGGRERINSAHRKNSLRGRRRTKMTGCGGGERN